MTSFPAAALQRLDVGARDLGIHLSEAQLASFGTYAQALAEGSTRLNLTAISEPDEVVDRHFLDSLSTLAAVPEGAGRIVDIGSGAGFPGLALKIARPALDVTLVEATGKKAAWLEETVARLSLEGVRAIAGRAETLAHVPAHRGAYDVAFARAVAPLAALCELCLPFLRVGGRFIAQKTAQTAGSEVTAAARALATLNARLVDIRAVQHPSLPARALVVIEQLGPLPPGYPRRPGMPVKRPL